MTKLYGLKIWMFCANHTIKVSIEDVGFGRRETIPCHAEPYLPHLLNYLTANEAVTRASDVFGEITPTL